jgi:hypothetical protein
LLLLRLRLAGPLAASTAAVPAQQQQQQQKHGSQINTSMQDLISSVQGTPAAA